MPILAFYSITHESDTIVMLMDFVSLVVVTEIDNWFGAYFEILLDAFYQEETIDNPKYLEFETDSLSKVSSFFWVISNTLITVAMSFSTKY